MTQSGVRPPLLAAPASILRAKGQKALDILLQQSLFWLRPAANGEKRRPRNRSFGEGRTWPSAVPLQDDRGWADR